MLTGSFLVSAGGLTEQPHAPNGFCPHGNVRMVKITSNLSLDIINGSHHRYVPSMVMFTQRKNGRRDPLLVLSHNE